MARLTVGGDGGGGGGAPQKGGCTDGGTGETRFMYEMSARRAAYTSRGDLTSCSWIFVDEVGRLARAGKREVDEVARGLQVNTG